MDTERHPVSRYRPYVVSSENALTMVASDALALGAVSTRTLRASRSSWEDGFGHLRGRVVGVATDCPLDSDAILDRLATDGHASLTRITSDGTRETLPVSHFYRAREATSPHARETQTADQQLEARLSDDALAARQARLDWMADQSQDYEEDS